MGLGLGLIPRVVSSGDGMDGRASGRSPIHLTGEETESEGGGEGS